LYTRADDGFYWLDVKTAQKLHYVHCDPGREWSIGDALSPDGKMATSLPYHYEAAGMVTEDLLLIDTATGKTIRKFTGPKSPFAMKLFSSSGSKLFAAGGPEPHVFIWDIATGKLLHELKNHTSFLDKIALSPDGRWLASWATVFNPEGQDFDIRLWDVETGKLLHRIKTLRDRGTNLVFFSADSSQLVSTGSGNGGTGVAQLWDVASGTVIRTFDTNEAYLQFAAMTSDGRMLVTTGADKSLCFWEVSTGVERRRISGHQSHVMWLDFSPDGKLLASASFDAPIFIWDVYGLLTIKAPAGKLTKEGQEKLWQRLADADAAEAFKAVCELIARPTEAVALAEEGWRQSPHATAKQMQDWLKDLNSDQFLVRKNATGELERFVTGHEDLLRKALEKAESLEIRQRLQNILGRPNPERLRRTRMLEILEQIGTSQARRLLQVLANQAQDSILSREAAAGLKRLER
jgi:WD domain, G-beta repeat